MNQWVFGVPSSGAPSQAGSMMRSSVRSVSAACFAGRSWPRRCHVVSLAQRELLRAHVNDEVVEPVPLPPSGAVSTYGVRDRQYAPRGFVRYHMSKGRDAVARCELVGPGPILNVSVQEHRKSVLGRLAWQVH